MTTKTIQEAMATSIVSPICAICEGDTSEQFNVHYRTESAMHPGAVTCNTYECYHEMESYRDTAGRLP